MVNSRHHRLAIFASLTVFLDAACPPAVFADATSGADSAGPVSSSTVTVGGEDFSVDPRGGGLDYTFTFFGGNVNYGQTPFSLSLHYQQSASATYVGAFTDSDNHAHPYGISAYLPTPEPNATESGGSQLDDAGAVWDLNLPVLSISTSKVSKFYGKDQIAATVSLGDTSYQYLMTMPSTTQANYANDFTVAFISAAQNSQPLYSVDGQFIHVSAGPNGSIVVQDKYGTNYLFSLAVLYGYKGVNVYDPTYNSSNNANADQVLVYRIQNIFYANGQTLNFAYADGSWKSPQQHGVTITDTIGNTIATINWNGTTGTVSLANQQGRLVPTHQLNATLGDYRISSIQDLTVQRNISFVYKTYQAVPYAWNNQTVLSQISNGYTRFSTQIAYNQFNSNRAYDAGCNKFSLSQIAVATVSNLDNQNNPLSSASYDYGFGNSSISNFILPQKSGKNTYGSGLNHWLDNVFYHNQDSDGCSSSDRVAAVGQTYGTNIYTYYPDNSRNRVQSLSYDALGRAMADTVQLTGGPSAGKNLTQTAYAYQLSPSTIQSSYSSFDSLPIWYGSPTSTSSGMNICTLNGCQLHRDGGDPGWCFRHPKSRRRSGQLHGLSVAIH